MASYEPDTCREEERNLLARVFLPTSLSNPRPPSISASAIGLSNSKADFRERWPTLTSALGDRAPPSAFWVKLTSCEPAMSVFSFGGRLSRERLIARCEVIIENRAIWSTQLGLDYAGTAYIDGVARDVLALLCMKRDERSCAPSETRAAEWRYAWPDIRYCSLCWRLVPPAPQTGFHRHRRGLEKSAPAEPADSPFRFRGQDALCAEHRPSLGKQARANREADQNLRSIILSPPAGKRPTWGMVTPEDIIDLKDNTAEWASLMTSSFPRTAKAFPGSNFGLSSTLSELSGLPIHAVEALLTSVSDHGQRAGMVVIAMLATCEKILIHRQKVGVPPMKGRHARKSENGFPNE